MPGGGGWTGTISNYAHHILVAKRGCFRIHVPYGRGTAGSFSKHGIYERDTRSCFRNYVPYGLEKEESLSNHALNR